MPVEVSVSLLGATYNLNCAHENTRRQIAGLAVQLGKQLRIGGLGAGVNIDALSDESANAAILNLLGAAQNIFGVWLANTQSTLDFHGWSFGGREETPRLDHRQSG